MRPLCFTLGALLFFAPAAMGQQSEIDATGMGTAAIACDSVVISFALKAKEKTTEQAADECARVYEQVVTALQGVGLGRNDIITRAYSVDPVYDDKGRKLLGYSAVHSLYISTKDLSRVWSLVDVILGSGVPAINEVSYLSTKADSIHRSALSSAVGNARKDAEAMAAAAGGKLGALIELTTHYPENPTFRSEGSVSALAMRSGVVRAMSITPQKYSVRMTVLGRWKFVGPGTE